MKKYIYILALLLIFVLGCSDHSARCLTQTTDMNRTYYIQLKIFCRKMHRSTDLYRDREEYRHAGGIGWISITAMQI
jgi:hypothetical protein